MCHDVARCLWPVMSDIPSPDNNCEQNGLPLGLVSLQPLSLPDYNITSSTAISEQHSVKYSTHNPYIVRWLIGDTISASHLSHPGPCYSTPSPGGRQSQNFSWDNILKILLVFIIKFSHNSSLFIRNWLTLTNPNSVQLMNFDSILTFPNQIYIFRYVLWPPRYYQPLGPGTSFEFAKSAESGLIVCSRDHFVWQM